MVNFAFLASYFAMSGLVEFRKSCVGSQSVADCLRARNMTRIEVRDSILARTLDDGEANYMYRWMWDQRYVEGPYNIHHVTVRNGIVDEVGDYT
jgi:hypothetical protein